MAYLRLARRQINLCFVCRWRLWHIAWCWSLQCVDWCWTHMRSVWCWTHLHCLTLETLACCLVPDIPESCLALDNPVCCLAPEDPTPGRTLVSGPGEEPFPEHWVDLTAVIRADIPWVSLTKTGKPVSLKPVLARDLGEAHKSWVRGLGVKASPCRV